VDTSALEIRTAYVFRLVLEKGSRMILRNSGTHLDRILFRVAVQKTATSS
jgi:hypothetical protein